MANTTFGSTTEAIKEAVNGAAGAAVSAIDAKRAPIAGGIDSAASGLHTGADKLQDTASYLRDNSVGDMASDVNSRIGDMLSEVQKVIKAYPAAALIGAVVVGFAAGRMFRRS